MKARQQKIQLILIFIGFLLILLTYFYYPQRDKEKISENIPLQKDDEKIINEGTTFENVEYKGIYDLDKTFLVKSEKAFIINEEPDIVNMKNMRVILYLKDGRVVNIRSNEGTYNKVTYDCFFKGNVEATDGDTEIFSDNLSLLATQNFVEIYNNVYLNYPTGSLMADKMDYNFETSIDEMLRTKDPLVFYHLLGLLSVVAAHQEIKQLHEVLT